MCREFDVDFSELPRLHGALGRDRTELRLRRSAFAEVLEIPMDLAPGARPNDPVPLRDLVAGWSRFSGDVWPLDARYLTAQIGLADNLGVSAPADGRGGAGGRHDHAAVGGARLLRRATPERFQLAVRW